MKKQQLINTTSGVKEIPNVYDNLFSEISTSEDNDNTRLIEIEKISPANLQPRTFFDESKLQELVNSFKSQGFKGAINVREREGVYEIVAGERRYRAAKLAGLETVRCIVDDYSDEDAYEFALSENLNRENLSKLEVVEGILHFITLKYKISRKEIVRLVQSEGNKIKRERNVSLSSQMKQIVEVLTKFGIKLETFRSRYLSLLDLPETLRDAHLKGRLGYNSVIEINKVKDPKLRKKILDETLDNKLSVRKVKERVATLASSKQGKKKQTSNTAPQPIIKLWKQLNNADIWNGENIEKVQAVMEEVLGIRDSS